MKVTIDIPESLDLDAVMRTAKLRLALQQTGFSSLTEIEKLGIVVLTAIGKAGLSIKKAKNLKKSKG